MKLTAGVVLILVTVLGSAHAQVAAPADTPKTDAVKKIGTADATNHYGETLVVTGKVAGVSVRPAVVILSIDKAFPNAPFTAVVFSRATNKFPGLTNLQGKDVEVSGPIKAYRGKPEIIMSNATQLTIVGGTNLTGAKQK